MRILISPTGIICIILIIGYYCTLCFCDQNVSQWVHQIVDSSIIDKNIAFVKLDEEVNQSLSLMIFTV